MANDQPKEQRGKWSGGMQFNQQFSSSVALVAMTYTTKRHTVAVELSNFFRVDAGLFSLHIAGRNDVHADAISFRLYVSFDTKN